MRALPRRLLIVGTALTCAGAVAAVPFLAGDDHLVTVAAAEGTPLPGQYIVTVKSGASAQAQAGQVRATDVKQFRTALNGFAAKLNRDQIEELRRDPDVVAIEEDQVITLEATQKSPLPWGLDRIDQRTRKYSKSFTYSKTASNVHAYIIDSGIQTTHKDFGGRADQPFDAIGDGKSDCNGHGTHVAGIVGGKTYGVAKQVKLHGVRVFDCTGSTTTSVIVQALDWVRTNAKKPAVANMSLGGSKSTALNNAVYNLAKTGVFVSVAAGNGDANGKALNACNTSPASAKGVMAVGATTSYDNRATWSNYGKCVDIHAPGYGIWSTWIGAGNDKRAKLDGTSMATPYVTGVAALYKSGSPNASFNTIENWLENNSTKNKVGRMTKTTPNRLLYKAGL